MCLSVFVFPQGSVDWSVAFDNDISMSYLLGEINYLIAIHISSGVYISI